MLIDVPIWAKLLRAAIGIIALLIGGYLVIKQVGSFIPPPESEANFFAKSGSNCYWTREAFAMHAAGVPKDEIVRFRTAADAERANLTPCK